MIHITLTDQGGKVGFKVEFDGLSDAEATMRGEAVQVELTPAVPLSADTRAFLSDLLGSAAQRYVTDNSH
jgi:hypothetical protein